MTYELNSRWSSLEELIAAYAHEDGSLSLDLGCGFVKPPGFVGLDDLTGAGAQFPDEQNPPDVLLDLNGEALPFAADSCSEVRCSHFLEHSDLGHVFDEVCRVLQVRGTFFFVVPYANSADGMFPGHSIFLTERWFQQNLHFQRLFRIVKEEFTPTALWDDLPEQFRALLPFEQARQVLFNVCNQMAIWATPRKDEAGP